jgi:hypothetical protein
MATLYPGNLDRFREFLNELDTMVSQDLNDLFDSVEAIQQQLGAATDPDGKPSGQWGSIAARLFGNGNLSEKVGLWQRLQWGIPVTRGYEFRRDGPGYRDIKPSPEIYKGSNTVWGEDVPAVFGRLQGPLTSGSGSTNRQGVPWKHALNLVERGQVAWVGVDGEAWSYPNNEFSTSNTLPCAWGVLAWGMHT